MRHLLIIALASIPMAMAAPAQSETQSETIARVCGQYGQDSQQCQDVSKNQLQLTLEPAGDQGSATQYDNDSLETFDQEVQSGGETFENDDGNFAEDVYQDDSCASGWRGIDTQQCTDG